MVAYWNDADLETEVYVPMLIEVGQIANQSFAGGVYNPINPQIFVGDGDYTTLFTGNQSNQITAGSQTNQTGYFLDSYGFG